MQDVKIIKIEEEKIHCRSHSLCVSIEDNSYEVKAGDFLNTLAVEVNC